MKRLMNRVVVAISLAGILSLTGCQFLGQKPTSSGYPAATGAGYPTATGAGYPVAPTFPTSNPRPSGGSAGGGCSSCG